ncbi:glutaredoxin family protein [Ideonella livida]|uniref:Glutaredoxin family protein n=1 Tax=Ideonella livida TaxID=2707176 RepID=A0A7C9PG84_9BURK|nr:glutaredoxin family protein [Ideonella livida]NDY90650.1 glutaredoxin family protein [Ideonella livida]
MSARSGSTPCGAGAKRSRTTARREALRLLVIVLVLSAAWQALQSWRQQRLVQALAAQLQPGDLTLLSSVSCVYCDRARSWLQQAGLPFEECFIEREPECATLWVRTGGRGTPTILVRGQVQLGFRPEAVLAALQMTPLAGGGTSSPQVPPSAAPGGTQSPS